MEGEPNCGSVSVCGRVFFFFFFKRGQLPTANLRGLKLGCEGTFYCVHFFLFMFIIVGSV